MVRGRPDGWPWASNGELSSRPCVIARGALARFGVKPYPLGLTFEVTWLCNLACSYCDRHDPMRNELAHDAIFRVLSEFYELGMRDIEIGMEGCSSSALHAVVGPQGLLAIRDIDRGEGTLARVRTGEGCMAARVPVLRHDDVSEFDGQPVDRGNDLVALRHGECAAGTEIVLNIDDDEDIAVIALHSLPRSRGIISRAMISTWSI